MPNLGTQVLLCFLPTPSSPLVLTALICVGLLWVSCNLPFFLSGRGKKNPLLSCHIDRFFFFFSLLLLLPLLCGRASSNYHRGSRNRRRRRRRRRREGGGGGGGDINNATTVAASQSNTRTHTHTRQMRKHKNGGEFLETAAGTFAEKKRT